MQWAKLTPRANTSTFCTLTNWYTHVQTTHHYLSSTAETIFDRGKQEIWQVCVTQIQTTPCISSRTDPRFSLSAQDISANQTISLGNMISRSVAVLYFLQRSRTRESMCEQAGWLFCSKHQRAGPQAQITSTLQRKRTVSNSTGLFIIQHT